MTDELKQIIAAAQGEFHKRVAPVTMEFKSLATQTQIANELIAIRVLLEHAVGAPAKK